MHVTMVPWKGKRDTASPRGCYGECLQHDRCLKHESNQDNEFDIGRRQPMTSLQLNKWTRHLYSAFICTTALQALYNHIRGVSPPPPGGSLPPPVCSIHLRRQPQNSGNRWRGESQVRLWVYGTAHFLGAFPLHGTARVNSTSSVEVPSVPYQYQNVMCKHCRSLIDQRELSPPASLDLKHETLNLLDLNSNSHCQ